MYGYYDFIIILQILAIICLIIFAIYYYAKFFFLTQEVRVIRKILEKQFGKITKAEYAKFNFLTKEDQEDYDNITGG